MRQAVRAEEAGFDFVEISDHYHPWLFSHEHSGFAWSVLGAVAARTERVELATGVTCPFLRYHPAVIAQAAAYRKAGGDGPRYGEVPLAWAPDEASAVESAHRLIRFGPTGWKVMSELPNPVNFEAATAFVTPDDVRRSRRQQGPPHLRQRMHRCLCRRPPSPRSIPGILTESRT